MKGLGFHDWLWLVVLFHTGWSTRSHPVIFLTLAVLPPAEVLSSIPPPSLPAPLLSLLSGPRCQKRVPSPLLYAAFPPWSHGPISCFLIDSTIIQVSRSPFQDPRGCWRCQDGWDIVHTLKSSQ
ncbi:hypothetical protein I79_001380 [Cricetulus griseus]|uniref:Uncharacterized protein n=1 Tax=Cricetulus griseus TaxID=10029 RepID=G3GUL7_CRIGR|nr:hypothetical protein I79_001380 [Cricetulus griseus]